LQLARVLDQDHPLFQMGHLREQCVGQRGLARAGAPTTRMLLRALTASASVLAIASSMIPSWT
jgi:hypothetical protein